MFKNRGPSRGRLFQASRRLGGMSLSFTPNASVTRKSRKASLLTALLLTLVTLFTVGCGSSSENFVYTGNTNNPGGNPTPTPTPPPGQRGQLIVEPSSLTFNNAGILGTLAGLTSGNFNSLAMFRAYYLAPGANQRVEVTPHVGVSFDKFFPSTVQANSFTYLSLFGEGIAVGTSPLGPTPAYGTTAVMTVTYIVDGTVYTDDVALTVGDPELVEVTALGTTNGKISLPLNTGGFPVPVMARYSNGVSIPSVPGEANLAGDRVELDFTPANGINAIVVASDPAVVVSTGATTGSASVDFTANDDDAVLGGFDVTAVDGEVVDVILESDPLNVNPVGNYSITLVLDDASNSKLDLTFFWQAEFSSDGGMIVPFFSLAQGFGFGSSPGDPVVGGRVLGVQKGTGTLSLGADIATQLSNFGFSGADSATADNNEVEVNVLSTVPLLDGLAIPL